MILKLWNVFYIKKSKFNRQNIFTKNLQNSGKKTLNNYGLGSHNNKFSLDKISHTYDLFSHKMFSHYYKKVSNFYELFSQNNDFFLIIFIQHYKKASHNWGV